MRIHICNHGFSPLFGYFTSPFAPRMASSDEICHVRVSFFAELDIIYYKLAFVRKISNDRLGYKAAQK